MAVGDVEGTVTQVGTLSTKIKTAKGEDVTIPNALVVSQTVTNYSRFADDRGRVRATEITIGYDVPWRQVEALAAPRGGPQRRRPPRAGAARQTGGARGLLRQVHLQFCLEHPAERRTRWRPCTPTSSTRSTSTACRLPRPTTRPILNSPKNRPRDQWFAAPAVPPPPRRSTRPSSPRSKPEHLAFASHPEWQRDTRCSGEPLDGAGKPFSGMRRSVFPSIARERAARRFAAAACLPLPAFANEIDSGHSAAGRTGLIVELIFRAHVKLRRTVASQPLVDVLLDNQRRPTVEGARGFLGMSYFSRSSP